MQMVLDLQACVHVSYWGIILDAMIALAGSEHRWRAENVKQNYLRSFLTLSNCVAPDERMPQ